MFSRNISRVATASAMRYLSRGLRYASTEEKKAVTETIDVFEGVSPFIKYGFTLGAPLALFGVIGAANAIAIVPAGHVGVYDLFGKVKAQPLMPGFHVKNPFAAVHKFSIKTQKLSTSSDVPSKEGLIVHLEVSTLFKLDPTKVVDLYKNVGTSYVDTILKPQFFSAVRQVTSAFEAKALYTAKTRLTMGKQLTDLIKEIVSDRGIIVEDTPLREIILPAGVTKAIEDKLMAEQQSQRMQFILQKEKYEAERKAIEAQGIAEFQRIVAEGVSEQLLKWKGIEATEHLAMSPNTKIVVVGGDDGLPLIFNSNS